MGDTGAAEAASFEPASFEPASGAGAGVGGGVDGLVVWGDGILLASL